MSNERPLPGPHKGAIDTPDAFQQAFDVSRETIAALESYEQLLKKWQKAHNLVAANTLDQIWHRHFADSAQLLSCAPNAKRWLDLGSGAGFPGIVLAILEDKKEDNKSECVFDLVESVGRKCAFLETVKRETKAPVRIHNTRVESFSYPHAAPPDVITARALASLSSLFALSLPFMGPQTRLVLPKGQDVDNELKVAQKTWNFSFETIASLTESAGRILIISSLEKRPDV